MPNKGVVQKCSTGDKTRHGWLCECDAVAWLVMVVSTWALLGRVDNCFSHTH